VALRKEGQGGGEIGFYGATSGSGSQKLKMPLRPAKAKDGGGVEKWGIF